MTLSLSVSQSFAPHHKARQPQGVNAYVSPRHRSGLASLKTSDSAPNIPGRACERQPQRWLHCGLQMNVELRLRHAPDERSYIQWFGTSYKSFDEATGSSTVGFSLKTRGSSTRLCAEIQIGEPRCATPLTFRCEISIWETPWKSCNTLAVRFRLGGAYLTGPGAISEM